MVSRSKHPRNPLLGLRETERMTLCAEDYAYLLAMLENPPEPNEALRKAFSHYKEFVREK
jgi:uncharacterized protein (DUF1778 family)